MQAEYKTVSFEPQHLFCTEVRIKREPWFWLKRLAWWLGLREKPAHLDVTYEFRYEP